MVTEGLKGPLLMDKVKIKQEKITPPGTPTHKSTSAASQLNITDDLLDNILGERKPIPEPIKSSNEILADLFKVFNAAPPTLDDDDGTATKDSKKKKKHKKERKVKKEKKRSRTNSETKSSDGDEVAKSKKRKAKKSKSDADESKRHKRHKKSKDHGIKLENLDVFIKKEKIDDVQAMAVEAFKTDTEPKSSDFDQTKAKSSDKNPSMRIQVSVTKDTDGSIGKRKIVIKNLADSAVYKDTIKEVDAIQKEKEEKEREKHKEKEKHRDIEREKRKVKERTAEREKRKHRSHHSKSKERDHRSRAQSHSSSLSLSDEETYLRERERERERHKVSHSIEITHFFKAII